jgi:hypothetical protein
MSRYPCCPHAPRCLHKSVAFWDSRRRRTGEIGAFADASPPSVFFYFLARLCARCAAVEGARGKGGIEWSSVCVDVLSMFSLNSLNQCEMGR